MFKTNSKVSDVSRLYERELGLRLPIASVNHFYKGLSSSINPHYSWSHETHGGVQYMDFSRDGSILAAACEKMCIFIFDPLSHKLICNIPNAQTGGINCVKFKDSSIFATCNDDCTITLRDFRHLKKPLQTLKCQSKWVNNIEFCDNDLLLASGFDGYIHSCNLNSYTEAGTAFKRLVHINGLLCSRLSPDKSKLIICTSEGYIMIVHDLNLNTFAKDLYGFKPSFFRTVQLNQCIVPDMNNIFNCFSREGKANKVELITDFPEGNDAELIYSLQIHPHGWGVVSRNISSDGCSEWTCVHDIQDHNSSDVDFDPYREPGTVVGYIQLSQEGELDSNHESDNEHEAHGQGQIREVSDNSTNDYHDDDDVSVIIASSTSGLRVSSTNTREISLQVVEGREQARYQAESVVTEMEAQSNVVNARREVQLSISESSDSDERNSADLSALYPRFDHYTTSRSQIVSNKRLTHYIEELNLGREFLKDISFSRDGRLICSPYYTGVRVLALTSECSELWVKCPDRVPIKLYEVASYTCHPNLVVSVKFSPKTLLIVSGCLNGTVVWHQPVI